MYCSRFEWMLTPSTVVLPYEPMLSMRRKSCVIECSMVAGGGPADTSGGSDGGRGGSRRSSIFGGSFGGGSAPSPGLLVPPTTNGGSGSDFGSGEDWKADHAHLPLVERSSVVLAWSCFLFLFFFVVDSPAVLAPFFLFLSLLSLPERPSPPLLPPSVPVVVCDGDPRCLLRDRVGVPDRVFCRDARLADALRGASVCESLSRGTATMLLLCEGCCAMCMLLALAVGALREKSMSGVRSILPTLPPCSGGG